MTAKRICEKISISILFIVIVIGKTFSNSLVVNCEISGVVKDSITGEELPFASIQIISQNDSTITKGVITDINGNYAISNIVPGKYKLIAAYMGYYQNETVIDIQTKKSKYNFLLVQKSFSLSEIVITAEKNLIEKNIEKTTVNVAKNTTVTGGTAIDVMQTLPSVDVDIDGNINYRGSNKVIILLNGGKSEIVKSLDQVPAAQIERIELINNPSAKYEAEGMSGIINIVLKSGEEEKDKTTIMVNGGYPEMVGGNVGYSGVKGKTHFFVNAGINHNTRFQIKEHLRENYENPNAYNYYQYDRQDENLNNALVNSNFEYVINKKQKIGVSFIGSKKFNNANREIDYETLDKMGDKQTESLKEIYIDINNYTVDASLNYRYNFNKQRVLTSKIHHSLFDQLYEMNNTFYPELGGENTELQNTYSKQINKETDFSLDYVHPFNDSILFEAGYNYSAKDLLNDFNSDRYNIISGEWINDPALTNKFNYIQQINAVYLNLNFRLKQFDIQAGLRSEHTTNSQNNNNNRKYIDFFPSVNISRKVNNHFTVFAGYNRRINRPTIKMLNPFSDEYADLLNMNKGNPDLKPEYVNSFEIGNHFVNNKLSGLSSLYFRNIDQAISRLKAASNDSALFGTFINLDKAKLIGVEIVLTYKPYEWWNINSSSNIFYTNLSGKDDSNNLKNSKTGWTLSISNSFRLPKNFGFQLSGYYRSKLPSVMGTYKERYYADLALNKKIINNRAQLIFKISDIFNSYIFGLELDAIDNNSYRYSQSNRRKNESRYFILSFIYNINGKEQQKKNQKKNFFLDDFDK